MSDNNAVRFKVTATRVEEMEFGLILDVTSDKVDNIAAAKFLAHFTVDEQGDYMEPDAAMATIRRLKVGQLNETVAQLVNEMQEQAVPNE